MSTADSSIIIIDCKEASTPQRQKEIERENERQPDNGGRQLGQLEEQQQQRVAVGEAATRAERGWGGRAEGENSRETDRYGEERETGFTLLISFHQAFGELDT